MINKKYDVDGVEWLLKTIHILNENCKNSNYNRNANLPTHKNIWRGSYDVWTCQQDRIDATEMPKRRMKEALDNELLWTEEYFINNKYKVDLYHLTEKGRSLINES